MLLLGDICVRMLQTWWPTSCLAWGITPMTTGTGGMFGGLHRGFCVV